MTRELVLQITVRNALLRNAIRAAGHDSVAKFARATNVRYTAVLDYLALKVTPIKPDGTWRESAITIADALRTVPEELFPAAFRKRALVKNTVEREVASDVVLGHAAGRAQSIAYDPERSAILAEAQRALESVLADLPPRERRVLTARFGLEGETKTLESIAQEYRVNRERIRQIEARAMRRIEQSPRLSRIASAALTALDEIAP